MFSAPFARIVGLLCGAWISAACAQGPVAQGLVPNAVAGGQTTQRFMHFVLHDEWSPVLLFAQSWVVGIRALERDVSHVGRTAMASLRRLP